MDHHDVYVDQVVAFIGGDALLPTKDHAIHVMRTDNPQIVFELLQALALERQYVAQAAKDVSQLQGRINAVQAVLQYQRPALITEGTPGVIDSLPDHK